MDLYTTQQIGNALRSVAVASLPEAERDPAVRDAIGRTLAAVGLAFGLEPTMDPQLTVNGKQIPTWVEPHRE